LLNIQWPTRPFKSFQKSKEFEQYRQKNITYRDGLNRSNIYTKAYFPCRHAVYPMGHWFPQGNYYYCDNTALLQYAKAQ